MTLESLEALESRIARECGYTVHLCAEIEFTFACEGDVADAFWLRLLEAAKAQGVPLASIGREQTKLSHIQQYECRFSHSSASKAASAVSWLTETLEALAKEQDVSLLGFEQAAKSGVYSGLHWHLHLLNNEGNYCFFKQEEQLSDPLRWTLGGLLQTMPALMPSFAPNDAAYQRLNAGADHIPRTQSWGGNNRSCALRLPESVVPHRHIEHRVCAANADPIKAVLALLIGVHYGLSNHCDAPEQCYGDANREDAGLSLLPMSEAQAAKAQEAANWLKDYSP